MKTILLIAGSVSLGTGLIILQLQKMHKYNPNAEQLIGMFKWIDSGTSRSHSRSCGMGKKRCDVKKEQSS